MGSKYRGGFSLLVPLWDDGIQFNTWRRANALAHDDGMFTSVDLHLMGMYACMYVLNVCMYVCMFSFVLFTFAPRMSEAASTIIRGHRLYWLIGGL